MTYLAYLDPGTGSFLLQVLAGGLFGGMFVLKRFWRQLAGFVSGRSAELTDRGAALTQRGIAE